MRRILLMPLVMALGCEGVGAASNVMPAATKLLVMLVVTIAFFLTARYVIPKERTFMAQTE